MSIAIYIRASQLRDPLSSRFLPRLCFAAPLRSSRARVLFFFLFFFLSSYVCRAKLSDTAGTARRTKTDRFLARSHMASVNEQSSPILDVECAPTRSYEMRARCVYVCVTRRFLIRRYSTSGEYLRAISLEISLYVLSALNRYANAYLLRTFFTPLFITRGSLINIHRSTPEETPNTSR